MSTRTSMDKTNNKSGTPGGSRTPSLMIRSHMARNLNFLGLAISSSLFCP
ncbi:MAG: hypothetical protein LN561_06795 [Rickettsia endosymbiont of Labidopullus appendiculatus]|nr:hypothetical protein [Rickettsia endosymbiont of Labidopullus appendiculatus]